MITKLINLFRLSIKDNMNLDQNKRIQIDSEIALGKKEFLQVVQDLQTFMMETAGAISNSPKILIELGAGVLPMKLIFLKSNPRT